MSSKSVAIGPWRAAVAASVAAVTIGGASVLGAPPGGAAPPRTRTVVDRAVVPAGAVVGTVGCRDCRTGACPLHPGHLAACRDGLCAPHCPVRPAEYGFYRTQWRRWPGQGEAPAGIERATPVPPPASLTPSAEEESPLGPPEAIAPSAGDAGATPAGDVPSRDEPVDPAPVRKPPEALPSDPPPENPDAAAPASPATDSAPREDGAGIIERTSAEESAGAVVASRGAMRYPAGVSRSLAAGVAPWRLQPAARQRPAGSARGL